MFTKVLLLFALAATVSPAQAELSVSVGNGLNTTNGSLILAGLRFSANPLFGKTSYYELNAGGWDGDYGTALVSGARGIEFGGERWRVGGSVGVSLISNTSAALGSAFQFTEHVQVSYRLGRTSELGAFYRHWSNASLKEPNLGVDFAGFITSYRW
jgi:hypothetical protein